MNEWENVRQCQGPSHTRHCPYTQDPAAYVPGTPTLGQYQPKSALRALSPHLSLLLRLYQQPLNQG